MAIHVADQPLVGQITSQLELGRKNSLISADGLVGLVTALSAVSTAQARLHVADKPLGNPVRQALRLLTPMTGSSTLIQSGSVANVKSAFGTSTWGAAQNF
jgi:hypothetical protein